MTEADESLILASLPGVTQRVDAYRRLKPEHRLEVREVASGSNSKLNLCAYLLRVTKELRSQRFDYAIASNLKGAASAAVARLFGGPPWIWYIHDYLDSRGWSRRVAARILFASCTGWIAVSKDVAIVTRKLCGRRKVGVTVYNCVVAPQISLPAPGQRIAMEQAVLFVGTINSWKGLHTLVHGLCRVQARTGAAPRVDIVGQIVDASYWAEVQRIAAAGQVELRYLGMREDVRTLMGDYAVLIHPTPAPEPFGLVVAEAILAGCFVISTAMGGVRELLPTEMLECRFDPADPDSMVTAMRTVEASRRKYERRQTQFMSELAALTSEKVYSDLLKGFFAAAANGRTAAA